VVAKFSADSVSSEYESVSVSDLLNVNLYNYSGEARPVYAVKTLKAPWR